MAAYLVVREASFVSHQTGHSWFIINEIRFMRDE